MVKRVTLGFLCIDLDPVILLNSLTSSSSFLTAFLGFSMYRVVSSANRDNFTSSFPIWVHLRVVFRDHILAVCDLGQLTSPLCSSVSADDKWG